MEIGAYSRITPAAPVQPVSQAAAATGDTAQSNRDSAFQGVVLNLGAMMPFFKNQYAANGMKAEQAELEKNIAVTNARAEKLNAPCQTCENRQYQDGSDDMGVSFKSAAALSPEAAAALVPAHEQEHVSRAQAEGREKNMNVTSSVVIHTSICPECHRVYVSGGTTRTTMSPKADNSQQNAMGKLLGSLSAGGNGS